MLTWYNSSANCASTIPSFKREQKFIPAYRIFWGLVSICLASEFDYATFPEALLVSHKVQLPKAHSLSRSLERSDIVSDAADKIAATTIAATCIFIPLLL